ncbi:MAG: MerR family transcriptional regulator [Propionibacteriaceae bacterium]|jgi:DNA-binding transcriptional MerR regulator|nr:MerR family transcriptional regulator [Propionibacteriaceae bacterium]
MYRNDWEDGIVYRIGEFSKLGKTTVKTLRYYDEVGLLSPADVDEWNGYRYYSASQLFDLYRIVALRQIGFSIDEIRQLATAQSLDLIERRREELAHQHATLTDQLSRLDHYLSIQKEGLAMSYDVIIKTIPASNIFSSRQVLPNYSDLGAAMMSIGAKISADNPGICCPEPGYCCAIYHDGEYKEHDIDVEICQETDKLGKDGDGYTFRVLPEAQVAAVLHRGPYDTISAAYAYLFDWVTKNGYTIADSPRESYIDGPWSFEDPAQWLTEVQVPVTK